MLTVHEIEKRFANVHAVNKLSFDVREGEIFALIGPNGAGKTTTVRMLTGIIQPDSGSIHYSLNHGKPVASDLGYLPEERGLYKDMPILETLVHMAVLRGMKRTDAREAAMQWLDRVSLKERALDKLDTLSKGNQQKVQFISAVLHRPRLIILDEPFSGLDPINQELFSEMIRQLRDAGATILLSAHQMQLVERIADRLLLMNRGRAVLYGTMDEIKKSGPWASFEQITLHEIYVHAVGEDVSEVNN